MGNYIYINITYIDALIMPKPLLLLHKYLIKLNLLWVY